jgi:hypothetical protein
MDNPTPPSAEALLTRQRNFRYVQIDAIAIGLANAATPYLPVFLTRLGATYIQVGLLSSMPGVTGLLLAIAIGRFLQRQRNIVPWFSLSRLLYVSSYALTGLISLLLPPAYSVIGILIIWALATLPQTMLAVAFSVVMNAVAGPEGRYELMSRRWSILGLTTALTVALVGQALVQIDFPLNYQLVFIGLSVGGFLSFYFSSRIRLPDSEPPPMTASHSVAESARNYWQLVRQHPVFLSFVGKRFVYLSGIALALPLFPLYFVREVQANDAWIGAINTAQTFVLVVGYLFWARQSRRRGARGVLLASTLGIALYPALTALTHRVEMIVIYAGLAGIFQAGIDLVFFDELMKTVPVEYSATFVAIAQSLQHLSAIVFPLVGTLLADQIGLAGALLVSAALRLIGFGLFASGGGARASAEKPGADGV